jgi:DNA-binding NarL/FixJ family response regulator
VLLKAIEKVHTGEVWLDRAMLASVLGELASGHTKPAKAKATRVATLTERERDVIALVCKSLKNKQIAECLGVTETTVRQDLTSMFDKLACQVASNS